MNRLKIITIILIIIFSASSINAQFLKEQKLKERCLVSENSLISIKSDEKKYPFYSGAVSFILPGLALGQLYNEQPKKFLAHLGITCACVLGFALGVVNLGFNVGGTTSNDNHSAVGPILIILSTAVFAGNWTWSVVDAVVTANKINENIELRRNRSGVLNKLKFGFSVDKNKQLNLKFALEL